MNFKFAEYELPHPALFAVGILAATALGMWWLLRRQRWL
jgi:Mg2+ and Co2+ transporter CorA